MPYAGKYIGGTQGNVYKSGNQYRHNESGSRQWVDQHEANAARGARIPLPTWLQGGKYKGKHKVFDGRTSLDWIVFRKHMVAEFRSRGVYHFVEAPAPVLMAAGGAVGAPI